jgi:tRNA 2-thiouridine synthesizing protein A
MDETLDLRGLKCPLPALLARRALARLPLGARLVVVADDPLAAIDIPHMCHQEGHTVEAVTDQNGYTEFRLGRGAKPDHGEAVEAPDGR